MESPKLTLTHLLMICAAVEFVFAWASPNVRDSILFAALAVLLMQAAVIRALLVNRRIRLEKRNGPTELQLGEAAMSRGRNT